MRRSFTTAPATPHSCSPLAFSCIAMRSFTKTGESEIRRVSGSTLSVTNQSSQFEPDEADERHDCGLSGKRIQNARDQHSGQRTLDTESAAKEVPAALDVARAGDFDPEKVAVRRSSDRFVIDGNGKAGLLLAGLRLAGGRGGMIREHNVGRGSEPRIVPVSDDLRRHSTLPISA